MERQLPRPVTSVTRLATLAEGGRITEPMVDAEIKRLRWMWTREGVPSGSARAVQGASNAMGVDTVDLSDFYDEDALEQIDLFDRVQLQNVIAVCQRSRSLSDAGRQLFQASRAQRAALNDSDRLRKYLTKFDLSWDRVSAR